MSLSPEAIGKENLAALGRAHRGYVDSDKLIVAAQRLGDLSLVQECRICRAVALINSGLTGQGQQLLAQVDSAKSEGVEIDDLWSWYYELAHAQVALDLAKYEDSWVRYGRACDLAELMCEPAMIGSSRMRRAHLAVRLGMLGDALVELTSILALRGITPNTLVVTHLLLAIIHGEHGNEDRAKDHSRLAIAATSGQEKFNVSRTLIAVAGLVMEGESFSWMRDNIARLRVLSTTGKSGQVQLEFDLLHARVLRQSGDLSRARNILYRMIGDAPKNLSIRAEAVVVLTAVLVESQDYDEALAVSAESNWVSVQPASTARLSELRGEAFANLGDWESSASCYAAAAKASTAQSLDILSIYQLHHDELVATALEAQNAELEARNSELTALSVEHQAMINAIGNTLQSPLTALQLNLELLASSVSESDIRHRTASAKRVVARLGRVANQLTLAGELEAESIVPDGYWLEIADLFDDLDQAAAQAIQSQRMTLNLRRDTTAGRDQVHIDLERSTQLVGTLFDGIAEVSSNGSVVDLYLGPQGRSHVLVEVLARDLDFDAKQFEALRNRQAWKTLGLLDPDTSFDLSFYVVARLCATLGCDLRVDQLEPNGTKFSIRMPGAQRRAL